MTSLRSLAVLLGAAFAASCSLYDRNEPRKITAPLPGSRIKFHNFSAGSVGVNFFANDVKMSAVTNTVCTNPVPADTLACRTTGIESTAGTTYGNLATGGLYLAIAPGQYTLASKIAARDTVVSSVSQTIADGKYYSFYMSGVYNATTKTAEAFVIEDPIPSGQINYAVASVRFVNAIPNASGDFTLYAKNTTTGTETAIGPAVAYKNAGAFVSLAPGVYDLGARLPGQSTNFTGLSATTVSFFGGRAYTITARGSTATTSTLALTGTLNQR